MKTLELSEHGLESNDRTVNMLQQLAERWANRLTLDNLRLAERYIEGKLCVIFQAPLADEEYVAVFQRHLEVGKGERGRFDVTEATQGYREINLALRNGNERCEQSMVLVSNIEVMNYPERFVPSLVRFGCANCVYSGFRHAAYFSRVHSFVFRGVVEDWKTSPSRGGAAVNENELVCQMIQGAPEVMNNVPSDKANGGRRVLQIGDIKSVVSGTWIGLTSNGVRVRIVDEATAGRAQLVDVLYGPFDL